MPDFAIKQLVLISSFAKPYIVVILALIALTYLYKKHLYKKMTLVGLSILSYPTSLALKAIFRHTRPDSANIHPLFAWDIYSFPSSHVFFYTAFFGFIAYLTFKLKRMNKFIKYTARFLSIYAIAFVGISRITLGVHWSNDVLAGYLFGTAYLLLLIILDLALKQFKS